MSSDPLTTMIRELNRSVLGLAALGGTLRLDQLGQEPHPDVAEALVAVLDAMDAPPLRSLTAEQARQALGLIRTFFVEAADLLDDPARAPGWTFHDAAILQGIGASSAGMVARMTGLGADRPWLAEVLTGTGTFLDVGTGVGGLALAAAGAWPSLDVVGIDRWPPSLALAERNRADSPLAARVRFQARALEEMDEVDRYRLAWLPTPFIDGTVVADSIPRLLRALSPGGGLIVGVIPPPPDALGAALGRLRTVRNGGHAWNCVDIADRMRVAGFVDVEAPSGQAGLHFILGRVPL